jgi:quinol monooxygenase YgiN
MRYLTVTECEVPMGTRQEFVGAVQRWEKDAAGVEGGPEIHAVYLHSDDPAKVLIITQFESREDADQFNATGLMNQFQDQLLDCTSAAPNINSYDLFYALGPEGARVVFGEDA